MSMNQVSAPNPAAVQQNDGDLYDNMAVGDPTREAYQNPAYDTAVATCSGNDDFADVDL